MRRLTDEDGAVAVIVGLILMALFGIGVLVLDVGNLYWERRSLQNGADAAALASAQDLAAGTSTADARTTARTYAAQNNWRGARVNDGDFIPETSEVTVTARTGTIDAAGELPSILAGMLTYDTQATAIAEWGYPSTLSTVPLIISQCEIDGSTGNFASPHPNSSALRQTLVFHQGTGGDDDPCAAQAGHDTDGDGFLPAGFGWLGNDGGCEAVTTVVDGLEWVDKEPGNDPECTAAQLAPLLNTVIQLPVFNDFCRPPHDPAPACPDYNNKDKYRVDTYTAFYLEGYRLGGGPSFRAGNYSSCSSSDRCLVGYFTTTTALDGDVGGPEGDVIIVRLKG
jgi:Flp pilus assembly protein TadG